MQNSHVYRLSFQGNPNVGIFAYATDSYCLLGSSVPDEFEKELKDALQVPIHRLSLAGTSLLGVFCAGNENMLLVPSIVFDEEIEDLKKLKIPFTIIDTKMTALGNNLVANEHGVLLSAEFERSAREQIVKALAVDGRDEIIVDQDTVGSCLKLNKHGGIIHRDASDELITSLSEFFQVPIEIGTVNRGVVQVSSGLILNSNGYIIGGHSTGVEVTNADEILGFLDDE